MSADSICQVCKGSGLSTQVTYVWDVSSQGYRERILYCSCCKGTGKIQSKVKS